MQPKSMNGPAMGVALTIGTVLIVAGVAGLVFLGKPTDYQVEWSTSLVESATASLDDAPGQAEASVGGSGHLASLRITVPTCEDTGRVEQLDPAVVLRWSIDVPTPEGSTETHSEQFTCDEVPAEGWTIDLAPAGRTELRVTGDDPLTLAQERVERNITRLRTTANYTLQVTAERGAGPLPVPVPNPQLAFDADVRMELLEWQYAIQERTEVLR